MITHQLLDRLEEGAKLHWVHLHDKHGKATAASVNPVQTSIAISLKRIADALEKPSGTTEIAEALTLQPGKNNLHNLLQVIANRLIAWRADDGA